MRLALTVPPSPTGWSSRGWSRELTPAVIAVLAAGSATVLRAPFFGALFAALLSGSAAAGTIPLAILSAVIGCLIALVFTTREAPETDGEEG